MAPSLVEAMIWPMKRLIWVMPPAAAAGAASQSSRFTPGRQPRPPQARGEADAARRDRDPEELRDARRQHRPAEQRPTASLVQPAPPSPGASAAIVVTLRSSGASAATKKRR